MMHQNSMVWWIKLL